MRWFLGGGFPMVFIVVFGAVALAGAVRFALHPMPGRVGPVLAYGAAVGFAALAGVAVDCGTVFAWAASAEDVDPATRTRILLMGLSEAFAPAILGFAILSVVSLVTAVGLRRMPAT